MLWLLLLRLAAWSLSIRGVVCLELGEGVGAEEMEWNGRDGSADMMEVRIGV